MVHWLLEQRATGRDRWPKEQITFHGPEDRISIDELIEGVDRHIS